jgi:hypothetical protein
LPTGGLATCSCVVAPVPRVCTLADCSTQKRRSEKRALAEHGLTRGQERETQRQLRTQETRGSYRVRTLPHTLSACDATCSECMAHRLWVSITQSIFILPASTPFLLVVVACVAIVAMFQSVALSSSPKSDRRPFVAHEESSDGVQAVADPPPKGALKKRTVGALTHCRSSLAPLCVCVFSCRRRAS